MCKHLKIDERGKHIFGSAIADFRLPWELHEANTKNWSRHVWLLWQLRLPFCFYYTIKILNLRNKSFSSFSLLFFTWLCLWVGWSWRVFAFNVYNFFLLRNKFRRFSRLSTAFIMNYKFPNSQKKSRLTCEPKRTIPNDSTQIILRAISKQKQN